MSSSANETSPSLLLPIRPMLAYLDESPVFNGIRYCCGLFGIFTNIFLLFIILSTKLRKYKFNWYLILLAIADLIIGIGLLIRASYAIYAASIHTIQFSRWICALVSTPFAIGFALSHVAVLLIAADRLHMVLYPLLYSAKFKNHHFILILTLSALFVGTDSLLKLYGIDGNGPPILLCSMGASQGPLATVFGRLLQNFTLALLFAFYIPFLIVYKMKSSLQNSISSTSLWRRQMKVTGLTIWILCLYSFLWGGPLLASVLISNYTANPQIYAGYSTFIFGFISTMCSSSSFIVYMAKHEEIREYSKNVIKRLRGNNNNNNNKVGIITLDKLHLTNRPNNEEPQH